MLIMMTGSGKPDAVKIKKVADDLKATALLALPAEDTEELALTVLAHLEVDYTAYPITAWAGRAKTALQIIKKKDGIVALFLDRNRQTVHDEFVIEMCKEIGVNCRTY